MTARRDGGSVHDERIPFPREPKYCRAQPIAITYESGHSRLMVYESQFAGTNRATTVTWRVGEEIDAIVERLGRKNVWFEHYDLPEGW